MHRLDDPGRFAAEIFKSWQFRESNPSATQSRALPRKWRLVVWASADTMATPHSPCTLLSSAFPPIGKRASPSFKFQSSLRFLAAASFIQMKLHVAPVSVVDEARLFRSSGRLGIFPCNASPSSVSGKARPGINPELGSFSLSFSFSFSLSPSLSPLLSPSLPFSLPLSPKRPAA